MFGAFVLLLIISTITTVIICIVKRLKRKKEKLDRREVISIDGCELEINEKTQIVRLGSDE